MVRFARKCAMMLLVALLVLGVVPVGQALPEWVQTSSGAGVFAESGDGDNGKFLAPIQYHSGISTPISTREELENIRNDPNGKYHLVGDIDLSGSEWTPIPNFSGMLYGQGHIIAKMTIWGADYAGLFSSMESDAVIRDIGFEDVSITINEGWAGSVSARSSGYILNCYSSGNITGDEAGGIVGNIDSGANIEYCYNLSNVRSTESGYVGGIVGFSYSGTIAILSCHNEGDISLSGTWGGSGGIIGNASSGVTIYDCHNSGDVTSLLLDSPTIVEIHAGGIVGEVTDNIKINGCSNSGTIYSNCNAGGIVGKAKNPTLLDCNNKGNIISERTLGGIIGYVYARHRILYNNVDYKIQDCFNEGKLSLLLSDGTVGGIAGVVEAPFIEDDTSFSATITVRGCYNTADIDVEKYDSRSSVAVAGGIIGYCTDMWSLGHYFIVVENCYNIGAISGSGSGIVGSDDYARLRVENCYNTGDIISIYSMVAGISNTPDAGVSSCVVLSSRVNGKQESYAHLIRRGYAASEEEVYNTHSNNLAYSDIQGTFTNDADRLISIAEAKRRQTYEDIGWDFDSVWKMVPGYALPQLAWQTEYTSWPLDDGIYDDNDDENNGENDNNNDDDPENDITRHSVSFRSDLCSDTTLQIEWGWNLFSEGSSSYDNRLAIAGLILSAASQNGQTNCGDALYSLGFGNTEHYNYGDLDGTAHSIAARKALFNNKMTNIFAVVIKGTTSIDDVFNDIGMHGFTNSANATYDHLTEYLKSYYNTNDTNYMRSQNNIFFVTGHSLGGASANLLSAKLSDYAERSNIYVYTTASPLTYSYKWNLSGVYNVVNYDDVVPHWSTALFSHRIGEDRPFNRENWPNMYVSYEQLTKGKSLHDAMGFWNSSIAVPRLLVAHDTAVYLSFLLVEDTGTWGLPYFFRRVSVRCPVDIEVYRGDILVGRVVNNQADMNIPAMDVLITVEGDEKYVYMPFDEQYTLRLTGTDSGIMEFAFEDVYSETGEIITRKSFDNVVLYDGKQMSSDIGGNIEETNAKLYVLDEQSKPVKEIQSDGTEVALSVNPSNPSNNNQQSGGGNYGYGVTPPPTNDVNSNPGGSNIVETEDVTQLTVIPFNDVSPSDWFYESVVYAYANKIFNGTSVTAFSPKISMTRAMLATVLYRLAGTPTVTADNPFADVGNDYWYTNAILWANQNNIVEGYENDNFGTNDPITREQLATMLYRYAEFNAVDITKTSDISTFVDATQISDYALGAMRWANAEGLVQGKSSTTLNPKEQATRAEVATIFMRFIKNGE